MVSCFPWRESLVQLAFYSLVYVRMKVGMDKYVIVGAYGLYFLIVVWISEVIHSSVCRWMSCKYVPN